MAPLLAGAWPEVHQMVSSLDDLALMFDDQECVPEVP